MEGWCSTFFKKLRWKLKTNFSQNVKNGLKSFLVPGSIFFVFVSIQKAANTFNLLTNPIYEFYIFYFRYPIVIFFSLANKYLLSYLPTYLPPYLPTSLPLYLSTSLPPYLPTYLPTYLLTYLLR